MTAVWIGGDVRAAAISRRTLGPAAARAIAGQASMADALAVLANSPYSREIRPGQTLRSAQHAIAAATLWNVRVLAGWVPAVGVPMMRILAGWWEIANIESQLRNDVAPPRQPYFRLGDLAVGWTRLATATSATQLCERLAATRWGRPDDESPRTIGLTLRTSLLQWASTALPASRDWVGGAAALLLARERAGGNVSLARRPARALASLLGGQALAAAALPDLVGGLPRSARWPFLDPVAPDELWRAECRWWSRVEADGRALLRTGEFGPLPVVGAVAVLAADAWRVRAALVAAANGERGVAEFDALA